MSAEQTREFVDANVLVYAYDTSAGTKHSGAQRLLTRLWDAGTGCVSIQVLQEFFVTVTRKVAEPLPVDEAANRIRELCAWNVFTPAPKDVLHAIALHERGQLSFLDAMVIHAAAELGCDVLWTEDLNHGQSIQGVRIRDPFRAEG